MKNRTLCWLFGLIIAHPLFPQSTIPDLTRSIEPPGTELFRDVNIVITDIAEGPYGFIWIASSRGLFRYDGTELFKVFPEVFIDIKYHAPSKTFAFTHVKGVYLYPVTGARTYSYLSPDPGHSPWMNTYCSAFASDSTLLIGQHDGFTLHHVNSGASEFHGLGNASKARFAVQQIAVDIRDSNWLWIATSGGLIHYNLSEKCQDNYHFKPDRPEFTSSYNVSWDVVQHADGRISLSTEYTGAILFDPFDGSYRQFYIEDRDADTQRLPDDRIYAIVEDPDGNVWYSSMSGALLYDLDRDSILYHLSVPGQDLAYHVGPHLIDSQGRFWGGYKSGLKLLDPVWTRIQTITCPGGESGDGYIFWDAEQMGNTLYFCVRYSDGLYVYHQQNGNWEVIIPPGSAESGTIDPVDMLILGDTILLLEANRLYSYQPGDTHLSLVPLEYDSVEYNFTSICHLSESRYWIMTESKGVFIADLEAHTVKRHHALHARFPYLTGSKGRQVYRDALGYLWVVTEDHLLRGEPGEQEFTDLTWDPDNEKSPGIHAILEEQGKMWVATYNGVFLVDPLSSDEVRISKQYQGVAFRLARVDSNTLWVITEVSMVKYNLNTGASHMYTSGFGIPMDLFMGFQCLHKIGEDSLLVGGFQNAALFRADDLAETAPARIPYLVSFQSNGIEVDLDSSLYLTQSIRLGPNENNLNIKFSSLGFENSTQQQYKFKLAGADKEWQTVSARERSVRYGNLAGGKYTFMLQTEDRQGEMSPVSTIDIIIAKAFFKKPAVQLSGIALLLGLFYFIYRNKVYRIEEKARMQEQVLELERKALRAQMNPHFVFNALNAIQYLITNGDELKAIKFLNRFSKLLRSVLDSSTDNKILLDHEIAMLENYMELEALRLENKFTFQIRLDNSLKGEKIKIPSMLLQPFVENAINHGLQHKDGIGHLQLEFMDKENYLICRVEDDGIGREAAAALKARYRKSHVSRGISISEARLRYYGKEENGSNPDHLVITDLKDHNNCAIGTRVEIKVPLEVI